MDRDNSLQHSGTIILKTMTEPGPRLQFHIRSVEIKIKNKNKSTTDVTDQLINELIH